MMNKQVEHKISSLSFWVSVGLLHQLPRSFRCVLCSLLQKRIAKKCLVNYYGTTYDMLFAITQQAAALFCTTCYRKGKGATHGKREQSQSQVMLLQL